jgi:hypothetical protein
VSTLALIEKWERAADTLLNDAAAVQQRGNEAWEIAHVVLTAKAGTYRHCARELREKLDELP